MTYLAGEVSDRRVRRVVLSSNISHYRHAADALASEDLLERFITGLAPIGRWAYLTKFLPPYWAEKFLGRSVAVHPNRVSVLVAPDLVEKSLYYSKIASFERAEWLSSKLFDLRASRKLAACDVFHFSSSVGQRSGRKAKELGAILICDERRVHPDVQIEILRKEHDSLRIPWTDKTLLNERVKEEYELADYIIVPSSFAKASFVSQGFDSERVKIVNYGVESAPSHPKEIVGRKDDFTVLYVGRGEPLKGLHYLIEAFRDLSEKHSRLIVVGRVDSRYGAYLRRLAGGERVEFVAHVPKGRLPMFFSKASVLVQPSLCDAFSLVCLEALSNGVPVISSSSNGSADMIKEGVNGFVVPPADPVTLVEKLATLASSPDVVISMGNRAQESSLGLGWDLYQRQLLATYDAISAEN